MIYKYIKLVTIAYLGLITASAYSWTHVIKNDVDGEILITVDYADAGVCFSKSLIVAAKSTGTIDSDMCCAQSFTVKVTSGKAKGQTYSAVTYSRAGVDKKTCSNFTVRTYLITGDILLAEVNRF